MGTISQDLSSAGMAAAIEANWIAVFGLWSQTPRIEVHEDSPDLRWYITPGVPVPLFNHVYFTRLAREENIDTKIEEVVGSFAEREVPFMWSVGPFTQPNELGARLESRGLSRVDELPGMAVDLQAIGEDISFPSELAIEQVSDTEVLKECIEVMRVGFELPELTSDVFFEVLTAVGLTEESPWRSYVGRLDGEAVAASALVLAAGVAGIYNVATLPTARKQGLGAAMTLAALRDGRELGYRIGVLQSSAMGFGVYRRLGFEQYSTYHIYVGTGQE
jgi:ribosomal protein S18 acetylase RimI-like enzyme